jgi:trans-aconitate 2-methyltransferase
MTDAAMDWDATAYNRFRGLRLRPAIDLMMRVPDLPPGEVVDFGCGNGAVAPALATRFPGRALVGLDGSPAMLAEARASGLYARLHQADATTWTPDTPPALIFSNALCHWLPDHEALFSRLAHSLAPCGTLAVQMPRQFDAPSHALMRRLAEEMFPDRFDYTRWVAPVADPRDYHRMLAALGTLDVWETEYIQRLDPTYPDHPVRRFTESTGMRPIAEKLTEAERAAFIAEYESALTTAYPVEEDGGVLFPFRRLFFVLTR